MPKITVQKSVTTNAEEAFQKLKTFLATDPDLKRMDSSYQCQFQDDKMTGSAKGTKFQAQMSVKPEGGSTHVEILIEIPLMMAPFKGMVETTIQNKLSKILG